VSNPLETLQNHINKKAELQAEAEWGELETLISDWFELHPAKYSRLKRNKPDHYRSPPLMRLSDFPERFNIESGLTSLAQSFFKDRTEILAEQMAAELVTKATLLP